MKNLQIILLVLLEFLIPCSCHAQPKVKGNAITYTLGNTSLRIYFCNEGMFRITKFMNSHEVDNEKWMVIKYNFPPVSFSVNGNDIQTSLLKIHVDKNPWRISVTDHSGHRLYHELSSCYQDSVANEVAMNSDEHFFGFGERMDKLDQRGQRVYLNVGLGNGPKPAVGGKDILRANYCPVPFMISSQGYAVFFHTAMPTWWDLGWTHTDRYSFSAAGGNNDYYFILGPTMEKEIRGYQQLTGNCPMMPEAAYGLHIGSYSGGTWKHENQASDTYVIHLIRKLRQEGIPFDLLWLDSTWRNFTSLGNGGCSFEFQDTFKDPKGMIDFATKNHIALFGLHIRSLLDNGKHNHLLEDAQKARYTIPGSYANAILNFFDEKAVDWWWKHAARRVTDMGVKFFKTDVGSALRFNNASPEQQKLHNLFPIAYAKAPYEHFAILNKQRGFNLTREGYAGIQRYPFIWAGDWGSEWQWFKPVIRGGLNISLSGVGYWSHCMGGFEQYSDYDTDLYIRWCQFGMFSPVSNLFGMDHPRYHAPWTYGKKAEQIFIKYDSLRYALLPYIYTSAWEMYKTSRPVMTPLVFDHPKDVLTYNICDQYMFGKDLMICPVTTKNALSRPVYFPGGDWIDFWTGDRILGRQWKSFLTPIEIMPVFIRKGAIIPQQKSTQYITKIPADTINLLIYPSEKSCYNLYEDDGISMNYTKGDYALTKIESSFDKSAWTMKIYPSKGNYVTEPHYYQVSVYLDKKPATIKVNNIILRNWLYNEQLRQLCFSAGRNDKMITIQVE